MAREDEWFMNKKKGEDFSVRRSVERSFSNAKTHAKSKGLSEIEFWRLLVVPRDRSNHYRGKLPNYVSKGDRTKVVQLLCKGKCGAVKWAETKKPFPGKISALSSRDEGIKSNLR